MSCDILVVNAIRVSSLAKKELDDLIETKCACQLQRCALPDGLVAPVQHHLLILILELLLYLYAGLHIDPSEFLEEQVDILKAAGSHSCIEGTQLSRGLRLSVGERLIEHELAEVPHHHVLC